jgi:hypothetical protein
MSLASGAGGRESAAKVLLLLSPPPKRMAKNGCNISAKVGSVFRKIFCVSSAQIRTAKYMHDGQIFFVFLRKIL